MDSFASVRDAAAAWLLGPAGRGRRLTSHTLLALGIYAVFALVQHGEVVLGLIDPAESMALSAFTLSGGLLFHGLVRTGVSARWRDPGLTAPQMVWGLVATIASYAITGPARGAVMSLMVLVLVFGMFTLTEREARRLALFAFAMLSAIMLWKSRSDPLRYPPDIELVHFTFGTIILWAVSALSRRMGALRARLKAQKDELQGALEQIRLLAIQDELTGLFNRRHMVTLLDEAHARHRRGEGITLALIDLDLFKRINDTLGHHAGDIVLRRFAEAGRSVLRQGDTLARWGGEEFLLMLPGAGLAHAQACLERLREALAAVSFADLSPSLEVTFSAGLAHCGEDDAISLAIEAADQAMYRAKTSGRNCTVVADATVVEMVEIVEPARIA